MNPLAPVTTPPDRKAVTEFVIAIINNKGGVGKTTVACNLGAALAQQPRRVLVLDLDCQCNASRLLLSGAHDFGHRSL